MRNLIGLMGFLIGVFCLSCTRPPSEKSKLTLNIPERLVSSGSASVDTSAFKKVYSSASAQTDSGPEWNTSLNPTALSEINCYAVFVGGPGLEQNHCWNSSTSQGFYFGAKEFAGFFSPGTQIVLEVPSGQRTIFLAGLQAETSADCGSDMKNYTSPPNFENLSEPHIIAAPSFDLAPGEQRVNITPSMTGAFSFDRCSFMPTTSDGGNTSPALVNHFGDGRDGSLTISSSGSVNFWSDLTPLSTLSGMGTYTANSTAPNPPANTKYISHYDRVTVVSPDGKTLRTNLGFNSDQLDVGDEVLVHVPAAWASSDPDSACGGGLHVGFYKFAKIVGADGAVAKTITLDESISSTPNTINSTNVAQSAANRSADFCRIQISRVPNFENLSYSGAGILSLVAPSFSSHQSADGRGGLLALRVRNLNISAAAGVLQLDASNRGFQPTAGYIQGDGYIGLGLNSSSANSTGGGAGSASGGGGGGGNTGLGVSGTGSSFGLGGNSTSGLCSASCGPLEKLFFGGAGGGENSTLGGYGGGVVLLFVESLMGDGELRLKANGEDRSSNSFGGGGAGGMALLMAKNISMSRAIQLQASGGPGGSSFGGAGGGGSVNMHYCNMNSTPTSSSDVSSPASGASNGASSVLYLPELCY